jgi:ABC-2 type transport system permease protein
MDIQCHFIPVNRGIAGGQADWQLSPWYYYPVLSPRNDHLITRALNMILIRFGSVIDTVGEDPGIRKTVLLSTSPYSRQVAVPAQISLREAENPPIESEYNRSNLPLGILLEGEFESVFTHRPPVPGIRSEVPVKVREKSRPTRMIVVSDGDIIRNDVTDSPDGPAIAPLGFDRYTSQTFGNREFILNAVNFLTDETGLMRLRGREFRLRLLDRQKIQTESLKWKLLNTLLPVILVVLFGTAVHFNRRRKYSTSLK